MFDDFLTRMNTLTVQQIELYAFWGAMGGFVHVLLHKGCLTLPRMIKLPNGAKALDLGFLISMCIGAATAICVDHNWVTSFAAAIAGPSVLEGIVKRVSSYNTESRNRPPGDQL